MTRFDAMFEHSLQSLLAIGQKRTLTAYPQTSTPRRAWLDFSSNDYLGLAAHPYLLESAKIWVEQYGAGSRSSRLVNGHLQAYEQVEEKLAKFKNVERALVFSSGWQANATAIYSLLTWAKEQKNASPLVFTDRLNHASLHYGCLAAHIKQHRFRHNDLAHLEEYLKATHQQEGIRFIVTETIFSMDGDVANLTHLTELAHRYNAFLYVDDAHATGLYGTTGSGLAKAAGQDGADLVMGTFSKALGGFGAYVGGSRIMCEWLLNKCSGFIHTTALPPSIWGTINAALDIVPTLDKERQNLAEKSAYVREYLNALQLDTGKSTTHIIPLIVIDQHIALKCAQYLQSRGIRAVAIRPPSVPPHTSRIRLTICADHTEDEIDILCQTIRAMLQEGVMNPQTL